MGGCKCAFYQCKNNTMLAKETNSIHSHFFHFPVKDEKRCVEWAIYSNNMPFLQLPIEKLKNKVICDKHFPETSFMNYTRSKLTKTNSIPTIYYDEHDQEVDLLETPTDWVIENRNNRPEPGFLNVTSKSSRQATIKMELDESQDRLTIINTSVAKKPAEAIKRPRSNAKPTGEVRILNKLPTATISLNNQLHSLGQIKQMVMKTQQDTQPAKKITSPSEKVRILSTPDKARILSPSQPRIIKSEIIQKSPETLQVDDPSIEVMYVNEIEPIEPMVQNVPDNSKEIQALAKEISEIKLMLSEKLKEPQQPSPSTSFNESSNITQSQFNKVQLFNGIKRYLSPSLIALLRMEIFAAPNREYKKDEKIICSEILKLGNEVYDFFNDEWRLRLPSKEIVKGWQSEDMIDDDAS